jgi:hypothetical protein
MLDVSGVSTEALKRELRLRQSQTGANPSPPASHLSDFHNFDEDTEEDSDDDSLFMPERRAPRISSGFRKSVEGPAALRRACSDRHTSKKYDPLDRGRKERTRTSASSDRTSTGASPLGKRRRSPSFEIFESEDESNPFSSPSSVITCQAGAFPRVTHGKRRRTTAQEEYDDRRLAERLAAEEEDNLLMLMEGQWTKARPGTRGCPINQDHRTGRTRHPRLGVDRSSSVRRNDESLSKPPSRRQSETFDASIARQLQREATEAQEARLCEAASRTRDCAVCGDATIDLPSLSSCTHKADVCAGCYTASLGSQLEENGWQEVKCPGQSCKVNLTYEEIKAHASKDVFERYDSIQARNVLSADPNFRWCTAEGCKSGQIHEVEEDGSEFVCVGCHRSFCILHDGLHGDNETCKEYEYRLSGQKDRDERKKEDEASEEAVKSLAKKCPHKKCGAPIEKNGGCNHITCKFKIYSMKALILTRTRLEVPRSLLLCVPGEELERMRTLAHASAGVKSAEDIDFLTAITRKDTGG